MKSLTKFLAIPILLFTAQGLFAQETVNKGDVIIHIVDCDAWGGHKFFIDIYKRRNKVKIIYSYRDSIKHAEIRRDPAYKPISHAAFRYPSSDPRGQPALDSLTKYFDLHSAYTRDSVIINIKRDTSYGNLLSRIAQTSEAELKLKHNDVHMLDGDFPSFIVVINKESKKAWHNLRQCNRILYFSPYYMILWKRENLLRLQIKSESIMGIDNPIQPCRWSSDYRF